MRLVARHRAPLAFSHSLKLSDALFRAGKPHELLPIGGQAHGVSEPAASVRLHERVMEFLVRHLGRAADRSDAKTSSSGSRAGAE